MIYAVLALTGVIILLIVLIGILEHAHAQERKERAEAYERSLQMMADRVQAPERLPVRDVTEFQIPEHDADEWNQVGQIVIADDYGLGDD